MGLNLQKKRVLAHRFATLLKTSVRSRPALFLFLVFNTVYNKESKNTAKYSSKICYANINIGLYLS